MRSKPSIRNAHRLRFCVRLAALAWVVWLQHRSVEGAEFQCTEGNAQCLRDAINAANATGEATTIRLDARTYTFTQPDDSTRATFFDFAALPLITGHVTIVGVAAGATILERPHDPRTRANAFRFFRVASTGALALDRLTLRGGDAGRATGGAIFSRGAVTIRNSELTEHDGEMYALIHVAGGTLSISDSRVYGNNGLFSTLISIGGPVGAGGPVDPASLTIARTTISNNRADSGHVIAIECGASALIKDTSITNNVGIGGGGPLRACSDVTIVNSTLAGGNFFNDNLILGPNVVIRNSTLIDLEGGTGEAQLQNTILARTRGEIGSCYAPIISLGHNLIEDARGCGTLQPSDIVGDPGLGDFIDTGARGVAYYPLLASSRAVDAGDPTACLETDQRGLARPIDGNGDGAQICDIGAVEFYPNVNELMHLDGVTGRYVAPAEDAASTSQFAAGGTFDIAATFTNSHAADICHVVFEVVTLQGTTAAPVMLTRNGDPLGGQGVDVRASVADGPDTLRTQLPQQYRFRIGMMTAEPITFFVNVLGESAIGSCGP